MKFVWWQNKRGEWYVIIQAILFALIGIGPIYPPILKHWQFPFPTMVMWAGLLVGSLGLGIAFLGILHLGKNLSPLPHPKSDSNLVESGIYGWVRHPIYSGVILGAIGWALLWHSFMTLVYALLLFIFFDVKSRREEKWLAEKFTAYTAYQQRVRKLIPFIY